MSDPSYPTSTTHAIRVVAAETGIAEPVVRQCVEGFIAQMIRTLRAEIPFAVRGFAKFYHSYHDRPMKPQYGEHFKDKVRAELKMQLFPDAHERLHKWVHDLGIKNNRDKEELMKLKIQPQEIEKIRRKKTLEDQRTLGFRSELLFEHSPEADGSLERELGEAPTVDQIARRIGMNMED